MPPDVLQDQYAKLNAALRVVNDKINLQQSALSDLQAQKQEIQSALGDLRAAYQAWKGTTP